MATREELEAKKVPVSIRNLLRVPFLDRSLRGLICPLARAVQELKEECQQLGLPVTGKKAELIDRILAAQGSSAAEADAAEPAEVAAAGAAPPVAEQATAAPANGSAHSSGKHQRIEFNLGAAEPAAAPAAAAAPASKLIKLGGEDEVGGGAGVHLHFDPVVFVMLCSCSLDLIALLR
jgi:hypothetical protein